MPACASTLDRTPPAHRPLRHSTATQFTDTQHRLKTGRPRSAVSPIVTTGSAYLLRFLTIQLRHTPCTVGSNSGRPDRSGGMYPLRVGVTMSLHKLTAGAGYDYLTRQVAALDATEKGHTGLASYYTERGETPGTWIGSGLLSPQSPCLSFPKRSFPTDGVSRSAD